MGSKISFLIIASIIALACNGGSTHKKTTKSITEPIARVRANEPTDIPVVELPTRDGRMEDSFVKDAQYPNTIPVNVDSFNGMVTVYGTAYQVWIGPKGWKGLGDVAPGGNVHVKLYPGAAFSDTEPGIFYNEEPSCQGCIFAAAAPYFPEAKKLYYKMGAGPSSAAPRGIRINKLSPYLVTYNLPDKNGLATEGVAYFTAPDSTDDAYFIEARFTLPAEQKSLIDYFVKTFIGMRKLK